MDIKDFPVAQYCDRALEMGAKLYNTQFDYSTDSLKALEDMIQQLRRIKKRGGMEERAVWNVSVYLGCYLGEVMLRDSLAGKGFSWQFQDDLPVLMVENQRNAISPISKIYKKLMSEEEGPDAEGTVSSFYEVFLLMLERATP